MWMSVLKTLITVTATLIVPTQRVPTLVLVEQVGLETGSRVQVSKTISCSTMSKYLVVYPEEQSKYAI